MPSINRWRTPMLSSKQYNSESELARAIAAIPTNHDEYELLIADMIKKFVHQEKYMVYDFALRLLEYGNLETPKEYLTVKKETHRTLMNKWCYGTYYSIGTYGIKPKPADLEIAPTLATHLLNKLDAKATITTN